MKLQMTPKRRFLKALYGGRVDRPSVAAITSVVTTDIMEEIGCFFPEAHLNAEKMATLAATSYEILGYDTIMPLFSTITESAALGVPSVWGDKHGFPVHTSHPITDPEEIVIPKDFLEQPSMSAALGAIRILRKEYGNQVAIIGKVFGAWSLAYHLVGTEAFLIDTILDPDKVKKYLRKLLPVSYMSAKAQMEAGADVLLWGDHATGDLVSADCYRDFLLPIHQEVNQTVGVPLILHTCGNTTNMFPYFAQTGFDAFHYDTKADFNAGKKIFADVLTLCGGINNPNSLYAGTPADVERDTRAAIEAGVTVLSPECAVGLGTPSENLKTISRIAKEYVK